jgi:hypothetical protein
MELIILDIQLKPDAIHGDQSLRLPTKIDVTYGFLFV